MVVLYPPTLHHPFLSSNVQKAIKHFIDVQGLDETFNELGFPDLHCVWFLKTKILVVDQSKRPEAQEEEFGRTSQSNKRLRTV